MKYIPFVLFNLLLICSCASPGDKSSAPPEASDRIPEPDRYERLLAEARQRLSQRGCSLADPDTSLAGIILRDATSALAVMGSANTPDSLDRYLFYSSRKAQTLTLSQFAGDGKNLISFFQVAYSDKDDQGYKELPIESFKTGKRIGLGMSKAELIRLLGTCYETVDSTNDYSEIYYRIEAREDRPSKILEQHNMPVYHARYVFRNEQLHYFEFGFEYP